MEKTWWREGYRRIAGVDEAGRGALFGPVVAAAVVLPPDWDQGKAPGLADSKLLSPEKRESLYDLIVAEADAVAVGVIAAAVIDKVGIVPATVAAMSEALGHLSVRPDMIIVDGPGPLPVGYRACAVIDGDALCGSVAAASVVAKVTRDRLVCELAVSFPEYGLEHNKGYGTEEHLRALKQFGPCRLHRRSYAPVAAAWGRCPFLDCLHPPVDDDSAAIS
mgnify:CR=1 FL=1